MFNIFNISYFYFLYLYPIKHLIKTNCKHLLNLDLLFKLCHFLYLYQQTERCKTICIFYLMTTKANKLIIKFIIFHQKFQREFFLVQSKVYFVRQLTSKHATHFLLITSNSN